MATVTLQPESYEQFIKIARLINVSCWLQLFIFSRWANKKNHIW